MLKKIRKNKKGFTLVEILVAVSILGIIVGPLLISLFSNNHIIVQARKETEATYVAKKIMEETLSDYYCGISQKSIATGTFTTDESGIISNKLGPTFATSPDYIKQICLLLNLNSTNNSYTSTVGFESEYADDFTYNVKIVPSGKNGLGVSDNSANYLHIYNGVEGMQNYIYLISSDGKSISKIASSDISINVNSSTSSYNLVLSSNNSKQFASDLNESKKSFAVICYSSMDAKTTSFNIGANAPWSGYTTYLYNYTFSENMVEVTADKNYISLGKQDSNVVTYTASSREKWDTALYEIVVEVYEGTKLLSSAESVIEVDIFS